MASQKISFKSGLTDIDTTAMEDLGCTRYDEGHLYKYVQFGATRTTNVTASLAAGDIVCYVMGATADLDLMTLVDSPNSAVGAGVVQATVASTGGPYYGWVGIKGVFTMDQTIGGSPANGDALTVGPVTTSSAKTLTKRGNVADGYCGVLVDNNTSTAPVINADFSY